MDEELERTQRSGNQERKGDSESERLPDFFCLKTRALIDYISENILSADLKWSLFCAACNSYRFDSALKPFPQLYLIHHDKQIERLREVIELCPSMQAVVTQLKNNTLPSVVKDLLYWVLIYLSEPIFKCIVKEQHQDIISLVSSELPLAMPDFLFSVTYNERHEQKFALKASNYLTKLAFHGSRLDNFYSITNYGLQVSFSKVAAFGPGIYLSKEIMVSLPHSPRGYTWDNSFFGSHISIVALCEVIDHPDVRSEQDSNKEMLGICDSRSASGEYLIVGNSDLVCIRYLLIYSSGDSESASLMQSPTLLGWIKRHKKFTFMLGYIIFLLGIGSSNSSFLIKLYRKFFKKFNIFESYSNYLFQQLF